MEKTVGGLYDRWNSRKKSRRTAGGFMNELFDSWEALPMEKVRTSIDAQRKSHLAVLAANGGMTIYDTDSFCHISYE